MTNKTTLIAVSATDSNRNTYTATLGNRLIVRNQNNIQVSLGNLVDGTRAEVMEIERTAQGMTKPQLINLLKSNTSRFLTSTWA